MNFTVVQNVVLALYSPSLFVKKQHVDKMYENFLSKCGNEEAFPIDYKRRMTNKEKLQGRRDGILGREQKYLLKVTLFAQEKKLQPKVEGEPSNPMPTENYEKKRKDTSEGGILKPSKIRRLKGLVQVARVDLTVSAYWRRSGGSWQRGAPASSDSSIQYS